jgi:hypothetical protein
VRRATTISRGSALLLFVSCVLAGASWFLSVRWRPVTPPPDAGFEALLAEVERLRPNTDAERDSWRQRREALRNRAWTQAALDELAKTSGGWRWNWTGAESAAVECAHPDNDRWPQYVAFVDMLGRKPGISIDALEVHAAGTGRDRRIIHFRLGLRFIRADEAAGGPAPVHSPPGPMGSRSGSDQPAPHNKPTNP